MNDKPLVSVLMTAFNREHFIGDSIKSVLSSTYKNFELIVVDDRSSDDTLTIARNFAASDHRIKVFQNESNLGDYPNRNKAASLASGKYIKYLDADDMIYPNGLEIMVDAMEKFPDAALGISQEVYEDNIPYPFQLSPHEVYYRHFINRGLLDLGPTGTIIKKSIFEQLGQFSDTRYISDTEYWLKSSANYPIVKIQSGLVFWRKHEGQEFQLGHKNNSYTHLAYNVNYNALKSEVCPLLSEEKKLALKKMNYRFSRNIINLIFRRFRPLRAYKIIHQTPFPLIKLWLAFLPWKYYKKL